MLLIPGYSLREVIKTTGNNLLFHAVRKEDSLPVILKTPSASVSGPGEIERYRREFGVLQRLQDIRGVPRAYAFECVQDRPILLLEAVSGSPLSSIIGRPLGVERTLELAISLCTTLAGIHRRGVIHKDIKPSNIIVTTTGDTCLIDFSIATLQLVEHVDAAPATLIEGTLAYMSPEQTGRMNRTLDSRTDLYSLGVTLYEMLTGTRPFHGSDALEWFHAHLAVSPPALVERVPELPAVLSSLVLKLLAKEAEERYQSAEGLKADLRRCLGDWRRGRLEDFPLGVEDYPNRFQLPQRLYGRQAQLDALHQGFQRVVRGVRPELFLVRGYSGIGKSALVHELHKPVVRQRGFFLQGKFEQLQHDIPYAPLSHALRGLTQQLLAGTDEELKQWRERLTTVCAGQGQLLVDLVPQLELVIGPQPRVPELPPSESQRRFLQVFRRFLGVFATPEHPLVLFLDDLQWADPASLRLLLELFIHPQPSSMLLIGTYRDNEVGPAHPLTQVLEELRVAGARMTSLLLEPLGVGDVHQLLFDALPGVNRDDLPPLAALAHEKTGGNPFFLLRFLLALHQDGLLSRTTLGTWQWDVEAVRARGYSDNVVDFMVGKLRELATSTQHLLALAACVGTSFSLELLGLVSRMDLDAVREGLEPALREGLVTSTGELPHRFLHDRIQQAAYALMSKQEREAIHLKIGRLLSGDLPPESLGERLFDVVGQFNAGLELLREPEERQRVARLNAEAGRKAQASSAHASAITYFATAIALLPGDPWETAPALTFELSLAQASSEFMRNRVGTARQMVDELCDRARTKAQWAAVYDLKSVLLTLSGDTTGSCACLLECLARMGMPLPAHPTREEAVAAHEQVWALLDGRPVASLIDLPLMTDEDMRAVMKVLAALTAPSFFVDANLTILHLSRMVTLSLQYGTTLESAHGYAMYGMGLGLYFHSYVDGHAFSRLGLDVLERHGYGSQRATVLFCLEHSSCWTEPYTRGLEIIRETFHQAVQDFNHSMACFCGNHIMALRLALGHDLEAVQQENLTHVDFAREANFPDMLDTELLTGRFVRQLRGLTPSFGTLDDEGLREEDFEARLTPNRIGTLRFLYWSLKMQARFMGGAYEEAREAGERAQALYWAAASPVYRRDFQVMRALTLAACVPGAAPELRPSLLEELRQHLGFIETWVRICPDDMRAFERMVSAELARVTGRLDEALHAYEAAIQSARQYGHLHHLALASELAANYWRAREVPTIADAYEDKAYDAYSRWGALGKARHLARHSRPDAQPSAEERVSDTTSVRIDVLTLVKAQQAISQEIVLEQLASTLLHVAIENAGAQHGALLMPEGEGLSVMALDLGGAEGEAHPDANTRLPWSLLAYVRRTQEHVLIRDASAPHPFSSDPWFEQLIARSVLCLPLVRQGELRGVLYLENNLATDAFTPLRLSLLEHLASQATISIENARLYANLQRAESALRAANDDLEKRVEDRTRELRRAQAVLVETARSAGMAEVATNVLHNVGNVLTSTVINMDMMRQSLKLSRMGRLKQVTTLLGEHRGDLVGFLTGSPQGQQLTDYLFVLADELVREQSSLKDCVDTLAMHIEHIRAIVQIQQVHGTSMLVVEDCDLRQLVEDALSLQMSALTRHGIQVSRRLDSPPIVKVDRHKVLQILVNLISNAKNAMRGLPKGQAHLQVRLISEENSVRIQVEDNGVGIAPENRARLFCQGFSGFEGGHGLGLHSSALAAELLGGSLSLESDGPGRGATATLVLPLTPAPA
ncbi:trifunctional serine/threonine-protein kinase/ATP-binding protein/sensor histidine kinase [Cystobacter fuscus]|nr:ATP-binding sensor histidine kinase [Cystobacter fuscus]